jgi:hypothetical protein
MTVVLGVARAAAAAQLDRDNPWPGLDSYDETSHEFFSGRALEADDLLRRILDEPVTVLFGKSGLGKTSLLNAGVFPRLREKNLLPIFVRLQIRATPEPLIAQVRRALLDQLQAEGIEHGEFGAAETLWECLHRASQEFWTRQNRLVRPVFVFDQFEELFTLGAAAPADVAAFREDLADLAENRIPAAVALRFEQRSAAEPRLDIQAMPYKIVIALREDFLADLEGWRQTMPSLRRNRMRLLPMGPDQALQAVCNERTRHLVPEALGRRIVAFLSSGSRPGDGVSADEVSGPSVEPALLSLFCRGVNEHRKRDGKTAFDEALLEGGKDTIVADFYKSSVAGLPDRARRFIEEDLVTEHGYRNSYSVEDALGRNAITAPELATLIDRHLLRHEHHLGTERVELTHDLLTKAVVEERDGRRRTERDEHDRQQRRTKFRGRAIGGAFLIVPIFAALTLLAVQSAKRARIESDLSRSRELAAVAGSIDGDPDLAIRLAMEGMKIADTAEARAALLAGAGYLWPTALLSDKDLGGEPDAVALNADGNRLAVLTGATTVTLWDVTTRQPTRVWASLPLPGAKAMSFSPDQKVIAVGRENSITVLDAPSGVVTMERPTPPRPDAGNRGVVFSADGRWLGWQQAQDTVALLDVEHPDRPPVSIGVPKIISFALVGSDKIVTVGGSPLESTVLVRGADGTWSSSQKFDLSECSTPYSVSPGARYLSATWKGLKCSYEMDAAATVHKRPVEHFTQDVVWSGQGRAFAELLYSGELIVGRADRNGDLDSSVKGDHSIANENDRTRLIAVAESATRLAFIDNDEHKQVMIFSLGVHKPFLTGFPQDLFAVAPSGEWFALASLDQERNSAAVEIIPIPTAADLAANRLSRVRRIDLNVTPRRVYASADSVVVVGALPDGSQTTTIYNPATGQPRYAPIPGSGRPVGGAGEQLLFEPPLRLVTTADGSTGAASEQLKVAASTPNPSVVNALILSPLVVSPNGTALAFVQARREGGSNAVVYAFKGTALVKIGEVAGMAESRSVFGLRSGKAFVLADDGQTITTSDRRASLPGGKIVYTVNAGSSTAAAGEQAPGQIRRVALSPTGQFEIRFESTNGAGAQTMNLVHRAPGTDGRSIKRFTTAMEYRFSSDDRLLAVWGARGGQIVATATGVTVLSLEKATGVRFLNKDTVLNVTSANETRLVPLDATLIQGLATWLAPRELKAEERCLYGLANAVCQ